MVVSDHIVEIVFPNESTGSGFYGIDNGMGLNQQQVRVPLTRVDQIVRRHGVVSLDIFVIDAEGNGPRVLDGAKGLLSAQKVRYLEFEVHGIGVWAT